VREEEEKSRMALVLSDEVVLKISNADGDRIDFAG
jgi:hypothetical protein